jgi:hypothetical protein
LAASRDGGVVGSQILQNMADMARKKKEFHGDHGKNSNFDLN